MCYTGWRYEKNHYYNSWDKTQEFESENESDEDNEK